MSTSQASRQEAPLFWGQRLPNFAEIAQSGDRFELYRDVTRGPIIVVSNPDAEGLGAIARVMVEVAPDTNLIVLGDVGGGAPGGGGTGDIGAVHLRDPDGRLRKALFAGRDDVRAALVADADQRGIDAFVIGDDLAERLRGALAAIRRGPAEERRGTAPVMVLPNIIEPALRDALVEAFRARNEEGTVSVTKDGERADTVVPTIKRRRDLTLGRDEPLYAAVRHALASRVMPELYKAWWVSHLRTEAFYVASYTADRGDFFTAHRDNTLPHTADRRIAISIELNDDYTGGGLIFPEYSDDRWRAPAGGGVAFSCSLMHEAVAVSEGTRYVLLVFLAAA